MDATLACASTYDQLAPVYDAMTADYGHERWLGTLHGLAADHGARGGRLLDLGCGTGSSFLPLLGHGFEVTGCDVSAGVAAIAERRAAGRARVLVSDMADLPAMGPFDVVTCLDDAVNHVVDRRQLAAAFAGVGRVLAPDGVFVFDTNTLRTYRSAFAAEQRFEAGGHAFHWSGLGRPDPRPGELVSARIGVDGGAVDVVHAQRHYPVEVVRGLLAAAGLETVAVVGQSTGCVVHRDHSEADHTKTVFVAKRLPS